MNWVVALEVFLLVDVFFVGVIAATAVRHARAHFSEKAEPVQARALQPTTITPIDLPLRERERLVSETQTRFEEAVNASTAQLHQSLGMTATQLDELLKHLGAEIVSNELERYRVELSQLRQQAQTDMGAIKTEISGRQAELEKQAADELAAEKQHVLKQIDTKLGDAVSSFLVETLQHNSDLGAQETYLRTLLEEHKADFTREVDDERNAT